MSPTRPGLGNCTSATPYNNVGLSRAARPVSPTSSRLSRRGVRSTTPTARAPPRRRTGNDKQQAFGVMIWSRRPAPEHSRPLTGVLTVTPSLSATGVRTGSRPNRYGFVYRHSVDVSGQDTRGIPGGRADGLPSLTAAGTRARLPGGHAHSHPVDDRHRDLGPAPATPPPGRSPSSRRPQRPGHGRFFRAAMLTVTPSTDAGPDPRTTDPPR